jgi:LSD1 subclass zinc finger protein
MVNLALDKENEKAKDDFRTGVTRQPKYRHTGLRLIFEMTATNRPYENQIVSFNYDVDVEIKVTIADEDWQSVGPQTFYPTYPVGPTGSQTFHRVVRYPQDLKINFVYNGYAYAFDNFKIITTIIDVIVLLSIAKTIMDFIVFYCLPNGVSLVLRNKRSEITTRQRAFMELGMISAVSVSQFAALDSDKDGTLNLAEIAKVFGSVQDVNRDQAMMIAKTILDVKGNQDGVGFEEFMSMIHGEAITFRQYLKLVKNTGGALNKLSLTEREGAMKAYSDVEKGVVLDESEVPAPAPASTAGAVPQPHYPPQVVVPHVVTPVQPVVRQLPPGIIKLQCFRCRRAFGVPQGARMVACPHCAAVNNVQQYMQTM